MVLTEKNKIKKEFYYRDPMMQAPVFLRALVGGVISLIYASLVLTVLIFIFPPQPSQSFFWAGLLLAFFLVDRLIVRWGQADYSLERFLRKRKGGNVAACFTVEAKRALQKAWDSSQAAGWSAPAIHLFSVLRDSKVVDDILSRLEVNEKKLNDLIRVELQKPALSPGVDWAQDFFNKAALAAFNEALYFNQKSVGLEDLFLALFSFNDAELTRIFVALNLNYNDVRNVLIIIRLKKFLKTWRILPNSFIQQFSGFFGGRRRIKHRVMNRAWTARPTPILDSYSLDYTDLAYAGTIGFLIGHKEETERLINILSRDQKNNALLVGEPGAGKDTIVAHLAFLISRDNVPAKLFDKRLVALNIGDLVAGAQTPGELQERVKNIVDEILNSQNIILYIPDFHNLTKTSGKEYISAADILQPVLQASAFQVIGSTTSADFRRLIEPRSDIANNFEIIRVGEISEGEAVQLLSFETILIEKKSGIKIGYFAVKRAVELAHRYLRPKLLPSSADDLIKEAVEIVKKKKEKVVKDSDIIDLVSQKTKIPVAVATAEEAEKLLVLEDKIHQRLIDQEEAVKAVASAIRQYRAGMARAKGPIASFLFIGPTGVGKTELAKTLAEIYFGSEEAMVRFDMSEYQDKKSIFRFIGSPEGDSPGTLTEAVKNNPYTLVLLDEFEKAHPDVLNLFLAVFDDGRLTDNLGNVVDFTNTIIIATSNAHSDLIKAELEKGKAIAEVSDLLKKRLTEYFRPELLNRFDDIITFRDLSKDDIQKIAILQLKSIVKQVAQTKGINLSFNDEVPKKLAELGWDPIFGARPLRGVIRERIRDAIAEKILRGEIGRGSNVEITVRDDEFKIEVSSS